MVSVSDIVKRYGQDDGDDSAIANALRDMHASLTTNLLLPLVPALDMGIRFAAVSEFAEAQNRKLASFAMPGLDGAAFGSKLFHLVPPSFWPASSWGESNIGLIFKSRFWEEEARQIDEAFAILEIDSSAPDEFYYQMSLQQLQREAQSVRWIKATAHQRRMQTPEAVSQLAKFLSTGQLSGPTLGRFAYLLAGPPAPPTLYAVTVDDPETAELLQSMLQRGELDKRRLHDLQSGRIATIDDMARMLDERFNRLSHNEITPASIVSAPLLPDVLTPREKEVAECLAQGLKDRDIAERLIVSPQTAKKHRQSIARKWGTKEIIDVLQIEARRREYGNSR